MSSQEFVKQVYLEAYQEAKQGNLNGAHLLLLIAQLLDPSNETLKQAIGRIEKMLPTNEAEHAMTEMASPAWLAVFKHILERLERMEERLEQVNNHATPKHAPLEALPTPQVRPEVTEKTIQPESVAPAANHSLVDWLAARNVNLVAHNPNLLSNEAFTRLAQMLGQHYDVLDRLYAQIKRNLNSNSSFSYSLSNATQEEIAKCTQFCYVLHNEYAMLSEYRYDKASRRIIARVQPFGDIINFFTGGWLEVYIAQEIKNKLTEADIKYDVLYNAKISLPNKDGHELDLLYLIDNKPLLIECKTGDFQNYINRFQQNLKALNITSASAMLLILDLNESAAKTLHDIHKINFVNATSFVEVLSKLLNIPLAFRKQSALLPLKEQKAPAQPAHHEQYQPGADVPVVISVKLNKNGLRPMPELRPKFLAELCAIFQAGEARITLQDASQMLTERLELSRSKITDFLKVLKFGGVFRDGDDQPVITYAQPVYALSTLNMEELDDICLLVYARMLIKEGLNLDTPEYRQMFLNVTGGPVPDLARLEGRDWRTMDGDASVQPVAE